jgi:hypothetical protein
MSLRAGLRKLRVRFVVGLTFVELGSKIIESDLDDMELGTQGGSSKDGLNLDMEKIRQNMPKILKFFQEKSAHVEVVNHNRSKDQIERIFFIVPPYCKYLAESKKDEFKKNVDMDNVKAQVQELNDETEYFIKIAKQEQEYYSIHPLTLFR